MPKIKRHNMASGYSRFLEEPKCIVKHKCWAGKVPLSKPSGCFQGIFTDHIQLKPKEMGEHVKIKLAQKSDADHAKRFSKITCAELDCPLTLVALVGSEPPLLSSYLPKEDEFDRVVGLLQTTTNNHFKEDHLTLRDSRASFPTSFATKYYKTLFHWRMKQSFILW